MPRALISGGGKMGRVILDALVADGTIEPVGCVDKFGTPGAISAGAGSVPLFNDAEAACIETKPDVVIDFTNAAWTPVIVDAALAHGIRPLIGTSGISAEYADELAQRCADLHLGGIVTANFALGAVLLMHMAKLAAPFFDAAEIIELHHDQKVDAPSGTSIETARRMIAGRDGKPFARNIPDLTPIAGSREAAYEGITIHSVRLRGLVAHQEVLFGGIGQTLSIRHDSNGRDSFIPGIILAAHAVMQRDTLARGLDELIGLV